MMENIQIIEDIKTAYAEFLQNQAYPKLDSLNNWGKNRYFFSKYFSVDYGQCKSEKISIIFNSHTYCLDIRHAPDFMDQEKYIEWLTHALQ